MESAGILGTYAPGSALPVATAATFDLLEREAWMYLGKQPEAILYLVDQDYRVYRMMLNQRHHEVVDQANRRMAILLMLLIFSVTCMPFGKLLGAGTLGLFAGISVFYALILWSRGFNVVEGAMVCEIILFLIFTTLINQPSTVHGTGPHRNKSIRGAEERQSPR